MSRPGGRTQCTATPCTFLPLYFPSVHCRVRAPCVAQVKTARLLQEASAASEASATMWLVGQVPRPDEEELLQ